MKKPVQNIEERRGDGPIVSSFYTTPAFKTYEQSFT